VAVAMRELLGAPVSYVPVREEDSRQALLDAGLPEWQAQAIAELQAEFATGDFARVTDKVSRLAGQPPRPLADFIADYAQAFRGH
jgi:hypothetical protein